MHVSCSPGPGGLELAADRGPIDLPARESFYLVPKTTHLARASGWNGEEMQGPFLPRQADSF